MALLLAARDVGVRFTKQSELFIPVTLVKSFWVISTTGFPMYIPAVSKAADVRNGFL